TSVRQLLLFSEEHHRGLADVFLDSWRLFLHHCVPDSLGPNEGSLSMMAEPVVPADGAGIMAFRGLKSLQPAPLLNLIGIIPFERKPNLTLRRIRMPTEEHEVPHRGFEIRSAIPVLRMFDEAKAKAFYLDYLGFEVDWECRFTPTAPLYMQIRLGGALLHLNG